MPAERQSGLFVPPRGAGVPKSGMSTILRRSGGAIAADGRYRSTLNQIGPPMPQASRSTPTDVLIGGIAGIAASVAMTVFANALFQRLPRNERYPLPPRELTEQAARTLGVRHRMSEPVLEAATLASHFGYGAAVGGIYPSLLPGKRFRPVASGIGYGLAVWLVSYLGWVPGLGLLRPAVTHPARRNALMIASHVVWGAALGLISDRLSRSLTAIAAGPLRDR
jgi:hypothetical protein